MHHLVLQREEKLRLHYYNWVWSLIEFIGDIIKGDMSGNFPYITKNGEFLIFRRKFSSFYVLPTKTFIKEEQLKSKKSRLNHSLAMRLIFMKHFVIISLLLLSFATAGQSVKPLPRSGFCMAYDEINKLIVLFGGQDSLSNKLNDT